MNQAQEKAIQLIKLLKEDGEKPTMSIAVANEMIQEHFGGKGEYSSRRYYFWKSVKQELERRLQE